MTVASKPAEPDYEKICREKGFVKPKAEVAESTDGNQNLAAASGSKLSNAAFLPLLLLSNLFFVAVTAYFTYRFAKRPAKSS